MSAADGFETLIAPYLHDLRCYCFYLTDSAWDAEDLYQEALTKAFVYYRKSPSGRITKSFLFSAARLLWIDAYRKRRRAGAPEIGAEAAADADYAEVRGLIEWLAERLPAHQLEMWLLAEYFGYSQQDIADRLGTTVPAVKSALHRAKGSIRSQRPRRRGDAGADALKGSVDRWVRAVLREAP